MIQSKEQQTNSVEPKKEWHSPRLLELDFSKTLQVKKDGGIDGYPTAEAGNLKHS